MNTIRRVLKDDQNRWNFVMGLLFAVLLFFMTWKLGRWFGPNFVTPRASLGDFLLIALATFRLIRLFSYDKITQFARDFFHDVGEDGVKIKPPYGLRRTLLELLECPWCTGVWLALFVAFFYLWTPLAYFPVLMLAIAGVASFFQLSANMIGWTGESMKKKTTGL